MKTSIKEWYTKAHKTDELGAEVNDKTFQDLYLAVYRGRDVYDVIGVVDSLIRERMFEELALRANTTYPVIYNLWLGV